MKAAVTSQKRDKLAKLWIGQPLEYTLFFESTVPDDDRMSIFFRDEPYSGIVVCDVPTKGNEYWPFTKTTERFRVRGTIKDISLISITLENCTIDTMPPEKTSP
jgi:hypothetical protein